MSQEFCQIALIILGVAIFPRLGITVAVVLLVIIVGAYQ